ncbi:MAG: TlpA family protein disulfide reductase [Fibrella sp.]|nr:TlpA family protein disulfide reductase [Armatimonadota bacterium]
MLLLAGLPAQACAADPPKPALVGRVVNEGGIPVPGVTVARGWLWDSEKKGAFSPYGAWRADTKGGFRVPAEGIDNWPLFYPLSLFTTDAGGKRGAATVVRKAGDPVTLTLRPLTPVRFTLRIEGWEGKAPFLNITVAPKGGPHAVTVPSGLSGSVPLPPGDYTLEVSSLDTVSREVPFTVKSGKGSLDLGTLRLEKGPLARLYGKPAPPLTVTEALGISPKITLGDYRGKWVLIDFWGWWCPPCVQKSLPDAVAFYDSHPEWRDRYQILAFHCVDAASIAELTPRLRSLETNIWKGRALPFPILLDVTETTIKEWGITIYPTDVLIDPEGNVVRGGSLELLQEKLKAEQPVKQVIETPPSKAQ